MITKVERSKDIVNENNNIDKSQLSLAAKLFRHEQKSALSRAVINVASTVAPEVIGRKVERLERQILLSGPEYDQAIEECSKAAQEDYQYAEFAFKKTESTLKTAVAVTEAPGFHIQGSRHINAQLKRSNVKS